VVQTQMITGRRHPMAGHKESPSGLPAVSRREKPNLGEALLVGALLVALCSPVLAARGTTAPGTPAKTSQGKLPGDVAALVDGRPILVREVQRMVRRAVGQAEVDPGAQALLQAQALDQLVKRRLVLAYARQTGSGASTAEVDAALAELKASLEAQGRTLGAYLAKEGLSAEQLRREIRFRLTWRKYLARYLTDQRRKTCFQAHRREFDGTRMVVSHILLKPAEGSGPQAMDQLVEQAEQLRSRILAGELAFEEAARKYSAAPTARQGGKLGPIRRHGAMVEAFARAAFALQPGRISSPVRTPWCARRSACI